LSDYGYISLIFLFQHCLTLLEDENATLASLGFRDNDQLLIEVRNKDLTWPEEMVSLSGQSGDKHRQGLSGRFVQLNGFLCKEFFLSIYLFVSNHPL